MEANFRGLESSRLERREATFRSLSNRWGPSHGVVGYHDNGNGRGVTFDLRVYFHALATPVLVAALLLLQPRSRLNNNKQWRPERGSRRYKEATRSRWTLTPSSTSCSLLEVRRGRPRPRGGGGLCVSVCLPAAAAAAVIGLFFGPFPCGRTNVAVAYPAFLYLPPTKGIPMTFPKQAGGEGGSDGEEGERERDRETNTFGITTAFPLGTGKYWVGFLPPSR